MSQELVRPSATPVFLQATQVEPLDVYRSLSLTLLKWKRLILGSGLVFASAAALALLLQPPVWSATAKILLKSDRLPLQVPGLGSTGTGSGSRGASSEELATEIEFFKSAAVLVPAARALRAASEPSADVTDGEIRAAVSTLRERIDVIAVPGTTLLQVRYSGESRREAEDTLRLVIDHYTEQHAGAYSGGARLTTFYEQLLHQAEDDLRQAEDTFRRWQDANNIVTLDGQINAQVTLVAGLDASLKRTEVEIVAARAAIASLTGQAAAQPERSVANRQNAMNPMITKLKGELAAAEAGVRDVVPTPLINKLKGDLVTAQIALNDLRQRYMDPDRRVAEKIEQIALIERELAAAERVAAAAAVDRVASLKTQLAAAERESEIVQFEMVTPNPLRESLVRELAGSQARLTSLLSQADALRGQQKDSDNMLAVLRAKRVDFDRLSRRVELAKTLYLTNSKRLDDSRVVANLGKNQLSNVLLIDGPRTGDGRTTKRQLTLVALAGAVGLGLGVAAAFAAELFNGTLRTPQEVEFHLGIPVVAAVPAIALARPARALPIHFDTPSADATSERGEQRYRT